MSNTLAILTTDIPNSPRSLLLGQALASFQRRIVIDEPDVSFQALRTADAVVIDSSVSFKQRLKVLRALSSLGPSPPALALVSSLEPVERIVDLLNHGADAVLLDTDGAGELIRAISQASDGQLYLSPDLLPAVFQRYRELCAERRRRIVHGIEPSGLCSLHG